MEAKQPNLSTMCTSRCPKWLARAQEHAVHDVEVSDVWSTCRDGCGNRLDKYLPSLTKKLPDIVSAKPLQDLFALVTRNLDIEDIPTVEHRQCLEPCFTAGSEEWVWNNCKYMMLVPQTFKAVGGIAAHYTAI